MNAEFSFDDYYADWQKWANRVEYTPAAPLNAEDRRVRSSVSVRREGRSSFSTLDELIGAETF